MTAQTAFDYVVIGNSAAGLACVEAIRDGDATGSIAIVSREPYPAYGRPLISSLLKGDVTEAHMHLRGEDFYQARHVHAFLGSPVTAIDAEGRTITLGDGSTLSYREACVATGSTPFIPPMGNFEGKENTFPFLSMDDCKGIVAAIMARREEQGRVVAPDVDAAGEAPIAKRPFHAVVLGSGLIGVKAAEGLAHLCDSVTTIDRNTRVLPRVLDAQASTLMAATLERQGITCIVDDTIDHVDAAGPDPTVITSVTLSSGAVLPCDVLVTAVGVRPNDELLERAGARIGAGVVCDERMRTSLDHLYAAGDCTQTTDALDGALRPIALWPNAVAQGTVAGHAMVAARTGSATPTSSGTYPSGFAVNAVEILGTSLITAGVINPPDDDGYEAHVITDGKTYAKFVTKDNVLKGYILMNRPERAGIYTTLIRDGVPLSDIAPEALLGARNIEMRDLPANRRWTMMHKGYPAALDRLGRKEHV